MRYVPPACEVVTPNKESCIPTTTTTEELKKVVDKIDEVLKKGKFGVNNEVRLWSKL